MIFLSSIILLKKMIKNNLHPPLEIPLTYTVFKSPIGLTGLIASTNGLLRLINKLPNENSIDKHLKNLTIGKVKNIMKAEEVRAISEKERKEKQLSQSQILSASKQYNNVITEIYMAVKIIKPSN